MLPTWVGNPLFPEELIDHALTSVLGASVGRAVSAMRSVALVLPVPVAVFNDTPIDKVFTLAKDIDSWHRASGAEVKAVPPVNVQLVPVERIVAREACNPLIEPVEKRLVGCTDRIHDAIGMPVIER